MTRLHMGFGKEDQQMSSIVFGSKCYIKREDNKSGKFDSRVDKGIFVAYSWNIKEYICYNLEHKRIVESINVKMMKLAHLIPKNKVEIHISLKIIWI